MLSVAVLKHHDQKQLGEERVFFIFQSRSLTEGSLSRNLEAEAETEARNAAYWLAPQSLLSLLSYRIRIMFL
jgi:hypothetical protein